MINIQICDWPRGGDTLQGFAKLSFQEELNKKQMFCLCLLVPNRSLPSHHSDQISQRSVWDSKLSFQEELQKKMKQMAHPCHPGFISGK